MEGIRVAQMVWAMGNIKEKPKVLHSCFFPKFGKLFFKNLEGIEN
jgi:hypothetical protein